MAAAHVDPLFVAIASLSTIVVSGGLVTDSVGVVIGGMVIAPMLGPNLALALSIATGYLGEVPTDVAELMTRTDVGVAGVILALASGVCAVLSLMSGLSGTLVGVMVAVALLPPA